MYAKKSYFLLFGILMLLIVSCGKTTEEQVFTKWGKTKFYENFLWKKYIPDTLYRTIDFEFNKDAKDYMQNPLRLALYKKTDGGRMLPVTESEMELFVNGKKCPDNVISVPPSVDSIKVGIVFNPKSENKIHHWYFRPIDDGGLDRINDLDPDTFNSENASLMNITAEKKKVMNPLKKGLLFILSVILIALFVWFAALKAIFFPTFKVGKIQLYDPVPYNSLLRARQYRKIVLTNKRQNQNIFAKIFTGKILYEVNQIWSPEVVIEPKDKKSVRLRVPKDYMADARVLKVGNEYTIQNMISTTKTKIKIL